MPATSMPDPSSTKLSPLKRGQSAFERDLDSRLGTYVKLAEQAIIAAKSRALRDFDLSLAQYAAMMALYYVPGQSAAQLARTAAVTPQTMSTVLARLESKRLVERQPSAIHSKVLVITLTAAGEALVLRADQGARAVEQRIRDAFTDDQANALRDLLRRVADALKDVQE